jgi:L-seryl-tRNA(Ser) seleniumtransferase
MDARRLIPRTDQVLADPRLAAAEQRLGRAAVRAASRRPAAGQGRRAGPEQVADAAVAALPARAASMTQVINATGVLLHTNLGRAPLSGAARDAVAAAAGCTDLEFDLATGVRGRRGRGALDALARAVPAAGAVHVVNSNAAALVLAATALAAGREIVVSRGELIEIGDGFRLPDLLESTGATIREVGTTNRTTVADYAAAIGPRTGFVLKVHPSNYRIEGFTAQPAVGDLAGLGAIVIGDIGSGLLVPHPLLPEEPDADSWLRAGADLVTASGDKLLGGPQAGLMLGRADLVRQLARHPLARALRTGKLALAAWSDAGRAAPPVTWRSAPTGRAAGRAGQVCPALAAAGLDARPAAPRPRGRRRAPGVPLASAAISLPADSRPRCGPGPRWRRTTPAVVGRVEVAAARPPRRGPGRSRRADRGGADRGRPRCGRPCQGGIAAVMQVIATAGHVDHGKSALLRALTGMEPDRWAEEQRRGLTIDLGYAWLTLPSGERIAFVDVPGHERFAANMLAGVWPVPAVLFVVAADGGWMVQSGEHLAVRRARHPARAARRHPVRPGRPGPGAGRRGCGAGRGRARPRAAVEVSAVTGRACPSCGAELLLPWRAGFPPRDPSAPVRLGGPGVQHRGQRHGGHRTLPGGTVARGDELLLAPGMTPVRVRGLESLGDPAATATGVARVALNLRGLHRGQVRRGMALVRPNQWTLATVADVRLAPPAGSQAPGAGRAGGGTATPAARRSPERSELFLDRGSAGPGQRQAGPGGRALDAAGVGPDSSDGAADAVTSHARTARRARTDCLFGDGASEGRVRRHRSAAGGRGRWPCIGSARTTARWGS